MRTARVATNETCNQNCSFCDARRPTDRVEVAGADAIRARIRAAVAGGATEIVLTGGEPTLRRDLPGVVAFARAEGASSVVLETNAALIDADRAARLAAAGLAVARVHTPAWGEAADAITRDPGGFAAARRGIDALVAAGVALELSVPVVRANRKLIAAVPGGVASEGLPVQAIVAVVPVRAPDGDALLPIAEATAVVAALAAAAKETGIAVRLDANVFVPPCAFAEPERVAHLYSMTPGGAHRPGYARAEACAPCVVADRCPGVPAALAGLEVKPLARDRLRRRLSVMSTVAEQIERELVTRELYRQADGVTRRGHTIRVNFHCNQACEFCFVSTHLPPAGDEAVRAAIVAAAAEGATVALSGGEPTLNPRLVEYVRLARERGAREIELQTNAIRLGDGELAAELAGAGVTDALVSLHGATAEVSDAITEAPGTFSKTVAGIDALVSTSIRVRLNFVFCRDNAAQFPEYVDMVARRWPSVSLTISFVASSTDVVPRSTRLIPRYDEVIPYLADGLRAARAAGLRVTGFDSMCGIPLCLVPDDVSPYFALGDIPDGFDRGEFVDADACRQCALRRQCFGIRRGYVELYGADELRPVREG